MILGECVYWVFDFLVWLVDCFFELMNDDYFMGLVEQ